MNKKEIIIWGGIIVISIVVAYFLANFIHNSNENNENNLFEKEQQIKLDGKEVVFKTYRIDQSFFISIPNTFKMLNEEELKSQYNFEGRPELVFTLDNLINIYISTTDIDMTDDNLLTYLNNKVSSLNDMIIVDKDIYQHHNKTFTRLSAYNKGDNAKYYNLRFFTLNNKLVTVEFNSSKDDYKKWEKVINKIMESICFKEEDLEKTK